MAEEKGKKGNTCGWERGSNKRNGQLHGSVSVHDATVDSIEQTTSHGLKAALQHVFPCFLKSMQTHRSCHWPRTPWRTNYRKSRWRVRLLWFLSGGARTGIRRCDFDVYGEPNVTTIGRCTCKSTYRADACRPRKGIGRVKILAREA